MVELYTSQGCEACTKANALIADLAGRRDVLALTFPVDYWDYLGWKDTFAKPEFSTRQRAYMRASGQREVFTLRIDGELPFAEIATAIGITENNAKVHFHHAVQRLKRLVAENGDPT